MLQMLADMQHAPKSIACITPPRCAHTGLRTHTASSVVDLMVPLAGSTGCLECVNFQFVVKKVNPILVKPIRAA